MNSRFFYWLAVLGWFGLCSYWYVTHIIADCPYQQITTVGTKKNIATIDLTENNGVDAASEEEPVEEPQEEPLFSEEVDSYDEQNIKDVQLEFEEDRVTIHYPYNSAQKKIDPQIDQYLKDLCAKVVSTGQLIKIAGYTDNVGSPKNNLEVAQKRAENIERALRVYGVPKEQIKTAWFGEKNPASTNDTPEGRYQNRRVEIVF